MDYGKRDSLSPEVSTYNFTFHFETVQFQTHRLLSTELYMLDQ